MCSMDLSLSLHSVQKRNQSANTDHEWTDDRGDAKVDRKSSEVTET